MSCVNDEVKARYNNGELRKLAVELKASNAALKHAEEALEKSENRYRSLSENSTDIVLTMDTDGRFTYVNPAVEMVTGFSCNHFIGRPYTDMIAPEYIESTVDYFERGLSGEMIPLYKIDILHRDGGRIPVEMNCSSLFDQRGNVIGRIAFGRDTTERRQVKKILYGERDFSKTLLNASPAFYVAIDTDGRTVMINETMLQALGYKKEEILGKDYLATLVPERNQKELSTVFDKIISKHELTLSENHVLTRDGRELLIEWHGRPVFNKKGEMDYFFCAGTDITKHRKKEEQLRFYSSFVEQSADGMAIADLEGKLLFANDSWVSMHGYGKAEELLGKSLNICHSSKQIENDVEPFTKEVMKKGFCYGEVGHIRRDGTVFPTQMTTTLLTDENGNPVAMAGMASNITEQKRAEKKLQEAAVRWESTFEAMSDSVCIIDNNGLVLQHNSATLKMFGLSETNINEKHCWELFHGLTEPPENCPVARMKKSRQRESIVFQQDDRWLEVYVDPILDHAGMLKGIVHVISDITGQITLQAQLRQAQKMDSIGRLAGGVAHDFNNMLSVILGHTEMALNQIDSSQPLHPHLTEIRTAAERSADLTRQLLAFARKQTISPEVLEMNETVGGMLNMLRRLIGEDIHLQWLPGNNLWPVNMDQAQVDQLLANLCVNSRDAIAGVGKITIETQNSTIDQAYRAGNAELIPGEYVLLTVSDDGFGMDKATMNKLFEPFFTTKKAGHGTGLGLAMVYGIVKQNNGFINVYSEPGMGTTFSIYLPRHTGDIGQTQKKGKSESIRHGSETILLVEDEPSILEMTMMMLEHQGYTVLAAATPGEAIRLAGEYSGDIHLLITDVVLPEMNGRALADHLMSLSPNMKRLFMSGYTADVIAHRGVLDSGINFIQKPFTQQNLAARVRKTLEHE